jgi:hypothetical protein
MKGGMRLACLVTLSALLPCNLVHAEQVLWSFDNLRRIGGHRVTVQGHPSVVAGPAGKAIHFSGSDSILIYGRPLVGAPMFTVEVLFRAEDGPFEQRFLHIAETDPATGQDSGPVGSVDRNARLMFELRVKDGRWALDTFVNSRAGNRPLLFMDKTYPTGEWHVAAQSYDGAVYRSYVDGVLQGEGAVGYVPSGPGRVRAGARMNLLDYFHGSIAKVRFTDRALAPAEMMPAPSARLRRP